VRVVFDTNVLARAHQRADGPARRALLEVISRSDVLVILPYILVELERVPTYPRLLKRSGLTTADIGEYLEGLSQIACVVAPAHVEETFLRDPTDAAILGTAIAGRADVLCTRDEDLFAEKIQQFCTECGIRVLTELELLKILR
jgi:putative PIN family toxin of toxin-antitoxin system